MKYCTLLSIVVVALAFISGSLIAWTCFDGVSLKVGDSNTIGVQSVHSVSAAETSLFAGKYNDPNHPGCLRKVDQTSAGIVITGSDNPDGSGVWVINAKQISPTEILVDFSPKGGPPDLLGKFNTKSGSIQWPDGNSWSKQ